MRVKHSTERTGLSYNTMPLSTRVGRIGINREAFSKKAVFACYKGTFFLQNAEGQKMLRTNALRV